MNIKKNLKDLALYSITPFPAKYHFEGVNNKRAATQLFVGLVIANVVFFGSAIVAPIVIEEVKYRKAKFDMKRYQNQKH